MAILRYLLVVIMILAFAGESSMARRRDKRPERKKKEFTIKPLEFCVTAFITLGYSTANADFGFDDVDEFDLDDVRYNDRMIYGGGLSFDLYPNQKFGLGFTYEAVYKSTTAQEDSDVKGVAFTGNVMYNFRQLQQSIPYGKLSVGYISINRPRDDGPDTDMGSPLQIRVGFGLLMHTGAHTITRFELYYNLVSSDDVAVNTYGEYVGVQMGVGVPF